MVSRPAPASVGLLVLSLGLVVTGGAVAVLDQPAAAVGATPLETHGDFADIQTVTETYTVRMTVVVQGTGATTRLLSSRFANGTVVRWLERPATADGPRRATTVHRGNVSYTKLTFRNQSRIPDSVAERAVRVDGATAYLPQGTVYDGTALAVVVGESLDGTQFVRSGSQQQAGETLARYDAVGTANNSQLPLLDTHPEGYLLVEPGTELVRRIVLTDRYSGERIRVRVRTDRGSRPLPAWVGRLQPQANRSTRLAPST